MDDGSHQQELIIRGGLCLLPDEGLVPADVVCAGGKIAALRPLGAASGRVIDAHGGLVLPGIVDIHGDAFERQIMPRPKTVFPLEIAMLETDRQLAANGITTAYHGITVSWEPGLRSLGQALKIIEVLDRLEARLLVDHRIHIRWETFALDEMTAVQALFSRTKKPLLAFNDHTTPTLAGSRSEIKLRGSAERAMLDVAAYSALLQDMGQRQDAVPGAIRAMASAAASQGIAMLSHDDMTPDQRSAFRALGAAIAEFPMNQLALAASAEAGDVIVLGAPNVVRGGSHNGAISAEDAIRDGRCTVLASDYYYPAQLRAAFALEERGVLSLDEAWAMIGAAPAMASGLQDRGRIEVGRRADLVVVSPTHRMPVMTIVAGRTVYRTH
jgi:alpha-D-ribose 1-methylphosphonate 5-triphosphate diphosphatase